MHRVFVYGTLKEGHLNHHVMQRFGTSKKLEVEAFIEGIMYTLGVYPAVIEGRGAIKGEVWLVDDKTLKLLDQLEDHPDFYERKIVKLLGTEERVMAYIMPKERLPGYARQMQAGIWSKRYPVRFN